MASSIVLVNGLPGSGKSTVAAELAPLLDATLVSKDRLKEAVADALGRTVPAQVVTAVAIEAMWSATERIDGTVVVESFWFGPRDGALLQADLVRIAPQRFIEVWCDLPASDAHLRTVLRKRHRIHRDATNAEWEAWASAEPVGISPVVRVDTSTPVHGPRLADQVTAMLGPVR